MRLFIFLIIFSSVLASCRLPGTQDESPQENVITYAGSGFEMQVPKVWIAQSGSSLKTPKIGTISAAFVSPEVKHGFSNTLIVMRKKLNGVISSDHYSQLNNAQTSKNYLEYKKLHNEPVIFGDSDDSRVYIFRARYNPSTPQLQFIQTAKMCGTTVYLIHFALGIERDPQKYISLIKTFQCK